MLFLLVIAMLPEQTDKVRKSEKARSCLLAYISTRQYRYIQHTSIQDYRSTRDKGSIQAGTKNVTGQQIITRLSLSCLREDSKPITSRRILVSLALHVFSLLQNFNPRSRLGPLLQQSKHPLASTCQSRRAAPRNACRVVWEAIQFLANWSTASVGECCVLSSV